jgi:predicted TIM-barrel fold metal-dependent hydrolase
MEEALQKHPKTRFIWCHAGISRRIDVPSQAQNLRRLLNAYPNLNVDLSWVVFESYLAPQGAPAQSWVDLIEAFPTRFMIGSDKVGHFADYEKETLKYNVFLDALTPETAKLVARDNFLALLPKRVREARKF